MNERKFIDRHLYPALVFPLLHICLIHKINPLAAGRISKADPDLEVVPVGMETGNFVQVTGSS